VEEAMSLGRLDLALLAAFGDRDEITIDEIRAALFVEYSESELLRRGINNSGQKRRIASCYIAGDFITDNERSRLLRYGIDYLVRVGVSTKKWIAIDKEKGVARRVRA
jgi:hypothetical protein